MKKSTGKSTERKGMSHSQKVPIASSEKKKRNISYTQGDVLEDIEEILMDINLKKPTRAYNYYISEHKEKEGITLMEASQKFSKKWKKLTDSDKKKYFELESKDKERYASHLELVRKHILKKPLKENATAYRIFLDEHVKKAIDVDGDIKEAKKNASEKWKEMSAEDKKEYNEKKKAHLEWYDNLRKSNFTASAYTLYMRDQFAAAKDEGKPSTMKEIAEKWKKSKSSIKEKYAQYAEEENEERMKHRDLYDIAFGVKPRRPHGAYKFFMMDAAKAGRFEGKNAFAEGRKLWEKLSIDDKEKYQRMAQKDKLSYLVKKMEFDQTMRKNTSVKRLTPLNLFMMDMKGKHDSKELADKGGFFNVCYKKWNKLDDAAKKKYYKKAEEDKIHTDKEREEISSRIYTIPKRGRSSYNVYITTAVPSMMQENPKKNTNDCFKLAAEKWKNMKEKEKEKFAKIADKEAQDYKQKMIDFEENGYYIDQTPKGKKRSSSSNSRRNSPVSAKRGKKTIKE